MINSFEESTKKKVLNFSEILFNLGYSIHILFYKEIVKDDIKVRIRKHIKLKDEDFLTKLEEYLIDEHIFISKITYCPLGSEADNVNGKSFLLSVLDKEFIIDKANRVIHLCFD